jgi:very-short-patch-repair endonuclease
LGFWFFRTRVVKRCKYLWAESRFDGTPCNTSAAVESLVAYLTAEQTLESAWREWGQIVAAPEGTVRYRLACLQRCRNDLQWTIKRGRLVLDAVKLSGNRAGAHGRGTSTAWAEEMLANVAAASAVLADADAQEQWLAIERAATSCRSLLNLHPEVHQLFAAVERRDVAGYKDQLAVIEKLHRERRALCRCLDLDARLRAFSPVLADAVRDSNVRAPLRAALGSFTQAWAWRRAVAWLNRFLAEHDAETVCREASGLELQLPKLTEKLAAEKAWRSCISAIDGDRAMLGALKSWEKMATKPPNSKYAERYRRDAREYMQKCRPAIPAWIMPLHRAVEQVEAEPEVFDVVIVDEASQTGPEGLVLQYLAKQCIVVGDDKQISPEPFLELSQVFGLMDQFLKDLPFPGVLAPDSSLFDQADCRYGSNRIMLLEHFRCMPEIIRFSNDRFYDGRLRAIRQCPASRLPPIQVRFVTDGYREGKGQDAVNPQEAAAVASAVIECLQDPAYEGKSFGVICLQGNAQAQTIEDMVLRAAGPEPFKDRRRQLLCGNPYSFQGDERDVIFLSMVASADGDTRNVPLVKKTDERRFNVAASRARDQVWLFHSIRQSDLNPKCMRRHLLDFCYNPAERTDAAGPDRFAKANGFEREVGESLEAAGFRVICQYEVSGKRIDLLVEDAERQVAVECDGDHWHGPDEYENDMARQRMLERSNWKFIRLRGSEFYANKPRAIKRLVEALAALQIKPYSLASDSGPRDWVKEVSGNECLEALRSKTAPAGLSNNSKQPEASGGTAEQPVPAPLPSSTEAPATTAEAEPTLESIPPAGVTEVDASTWYDIECWGYKSEVLDVRDRRLANRLCALARKGQPPSSTETQQAARLLKKVHDAGRGLGFPPCRVSWDKICRSLELPPPS